MGSAGVAGRHWRPAMIDYNTLPPGALFRSPEFLRPGPVTMDCTPWDAMLADGHASPPAVRKGRLTARKWAEIRRFLAAAAADEARLHGRPWPSSMSTKRTTAQVSEADKMADIPGHICQAYDPQLAVS
jgi:hypothetical protein